MSASGPYVAMSPIWTWTIGMFGMSINGLCVCLLCRSWWTCRVRCLWRLIISHELRAVEFYCI